MTYSFELGPIRPPSEAYSLLIRASRNCPWNRCKFCHTYKEEKFGLRSVDEIKKDIQTAKLIKDKITEASWKSGYGSRISEVAGTVLNSPYNAAVRNVALWLYGGGETVFLQDANSLIMKTSDLAEVIRFLKETFPNVNRVTSYARSKTAARKTLEELIELREAGLSRLHIGLESGSDPILEFIDKGETADDHIKGGRKVVESGISLCEYVILGMGGRDLWRDHALKTAEVLNQIDPAYIRVRTLTINDRVPLRKDVADGKFIRASEEQIIQEERLLIEHLDCHSNYVSDHISNLLDVEGNIAQDKEKMLATIDKFLSLSPEEKTNFKVGRRVGIYSCLADLSDSRRHELAEQAVRRLSHNGGEVDDKTIYALMEGFI